MRSSCSAITIMLALSGASMAATIHVPADYSTIQSALHAAAQGDVIVVAPGVYTDTGDQVVNMLGKSVTLMSNGGAATTIIDGQGTRRGLSCLGGETSDTHISGFTITNCVAPTSTNTGGGVYCGTNSSPVIEDCHITENLAWFGPGMMIEGNATILNCLITNNSSYNDSSANSYGGGILCTYGNPTINGCTVSGNGSYWGPGICLYDSGATIEHCTIANNIGEQGGGVYVRSKSPTIQYCTIESNSVAAAGGGLYLFTDSSPSIRNCHIINNYSESFGAGVCGYLNGSAHFESCVIFGNNTPGNGGGFWTYGSTSAMTIEGCHITNNTGFSGGGIYNDPSYASTISVSHSTLCSNEPDQTYGPWTDAGNNDIDEICLPEPGMRPCCTGSGCSLLTEIQCNALGGQWLSNQADCNACPPVGACCLCTGCVLVTENACVNIGGSWIASSDCNDCPPTATTGVCCLASGCILNASESDCIINLGIWLPNNATCADCPQPCFGDLDGNWVVDINDLLILLGHYGTCP